MGYYADLEKLWEVNRKRRKRSGSNRQPQSLRGPKLVGELLRLGALTQDPRFKDVVSALKQHGIIDEQFKFNRHWAPLRFAEAEDLDRFFNVWKVLILHEMKGQSVRRACAQVAAEGGIEAGSFAAAVKRLQIQHAKLPQSASSGGSDYFLIYGKAAATLLTAPK
jgi:hypothetical protein